MSYKPLLTLIIPSYNAEQYLDNCLQSLLISSKNDILEIIVVDDGSKDTTATIAKKYVNTYPNTVKLIQKENGGHGSTINAGVQIATGKYFKVLDADDEFLNIDDFLNMLTTVDADAIITNYQTKNIKTHEIFYYTVDEIYANKLLTVKDVVENFSKIGKNCCFHGLTYNTQKYKNNNITLTEKVFFEDTEWACYPFSYIETMYVLPLCIYNYNIGNENQSVAKHNQVARLDDIEKVIINMISFQSEHSMSNEANEYFYLIIKRILMVYFATVLIKNTRKKQGRQRSKNFINFLQSNSPIAYKKVKSKVLIYTVCNVVHIPASVLENNKILKKIKLKLIK